jgi:hypothetical protein
MTVEFIFGLGQKVIVTEIARPGVVVAMRLDCFGKQVLVACWNDGSRVETWVYEWELEARGG